MIRLAFRFDDPSETSNQEIEWGIIEALRRHQTSANFAVIPFRMVDGAKIALSEQRALPLVEAARDGIIEVALHGHAHVRIHPDMERPSEFVGRSKSEQQAMIQEGRAHLESVFGKAITGFVPPWNSFDSVTLSILEQSGFKYVSAGWAPLAKSSGKIKFLPLTAHLTEMKLAVHEARKFIKADPVIVVVMHHYDFVESGSSKAVISLMEFSNILSWLKGQDDIKIRTLTEISDMMISRDTALQQHRIRAMSRLFEHLIPKHSFMSTSPWRGMFSKAFN
jgi:predicted deacetylase